MLPKGNGRLREGDDGAAGQTARGAGPHAEACPGAEPHSDAQPRPAAANGAAAPAIQAVPLPGGVPPYMAVANSAASSTLQGILN